MKIMVAYDGTMQAKEALVYGIEQARAKNAELVALHVFNSPLFADYDATIGARDAARAEAARFVNEAKAIISEKAAGTRTSLYSTDGDPEAAVIDFAKAEKVDVLLCPPAYRTIIDRFERTLAASDLSKETAAGKITAFAVSNKA